MNGTKALKGKCDLCGKHVFGTDVTDEEGETSLFLCDKCLKPLHTVSSEVNEEKKNGTSK